MDFNSISRMNSAGAADFMAQMDRTPVTAPSEIVSAVRALNKSEMFGENRQLAFSRDEETHRPVIRIVDRQTGETIDQIPAEMVLRMMAELKHPNAATGAGE